MSPEASQLLGRRLVAFGVIVAVLAVPILLVHPAHSDPAQPAGFTTTASVTSPAQTNVLNPGPLTGLVDGTSVTINMEATPGSASAGKFFGAEVRLCKGGLNIIFQSQYNPTQGGNCIPVAFDSQSDADAVVTADATNSMATVTFRVGTGSQTFQANSSSTVTCGAADPCALWIKEQFNTSLLSSGFQFVHFDLQYAEPTTTLPPSTTTTVAPTTTTVAPTTTTVAPTTTTVAPTTTTAAPTTTTTVASTTTTVPPTTTTTVPPTTTTVRPTTTTTAAPPTTAPPTTAPSRNRSVCTVLRLLETFLPFLRPLIDPIVRFLGCPAGGTISIG